MPRNKINNHLPQCPYCGEILSTRGKIIKALKENKELTISELSKMIGKKRTTTYYWLERIPGMRLIKEQNKSGQPVFISLKEVVKGGC